uniref:SWIM-type domain-containing protein n=1 Tax=Cajanus cajan TaxID=3821 RepID=A0A151U3E1_CAJCA|nr:hypothetical protein KK1_006471 [Cajanus cajan]
MTFDSKEEVQYVLNMHHIKKGLYYRMGKLSPTLIVARCVNDECDWRYRATIIIRSQKWEVRKLSDEHSCSSPVISQDHVNLGSVYISKSILALVERDPSISIPIIIAHIKSAERYTISYRKAWMAKQKPIEDLHGNWEQSYHDLPKLLNAMTIFLNGFFVEKQTRPLYNQQGEMVHDYVQFHRVFWTFKPCIDGFKYCKPIIQVFLVQETINPRERRSTGNFTVRLYDKLCDCMKFQKLHMPCSHVVAPCKHLHHNYKSYINQVYTLEYVSNVYNELFGEWPNESYWPDCEEPQIIPNSKYIRNKKGRPKSS